ncbi:MAG TPA: NYN domain-containing protein [Verrucomicrobiae bacterium]
MALVRILVDGYSLLHNWPELAPGKARHSAAARDELIHVLTRYRDAIGTPITVIFDGSGAPSGTPKAQSTPEMEVLYSGPGNTADDLIERAAYRMKPYGEAMVVTDDYAERDTVLNCGATPASCANFINMIHSALNDLEADVESYNRRELNRYKNSGR